MLAFPIVTAVVLAVLTVFIWGRQRGRPQQVAWAVALVIGLVGTVAYTASALLGGAPSLFRLYYLGGAVLSAPMLGVGSCYLLPGRIWARAMLAVTVVCGVVAAVGLWLSPVAVSALSSLGVAPGTGIITSPLVVIPTAVGNALGSFAIIGVAVWSLVRSLRGHAPWRIAGGNVLIAAGALILAAGGSLARLGHGDGFWVTMAVGWAILAGGVLVMSAFRPRTQA